MDNKVANVLLGFGVIQIVIGVLLGFVFGYDYYVDWGILFTWIGIGTVSGMFTIGFSQIIELLHQINLKLGASPSEEMDKNISTTELKSGRADDNKFKL